MLLSCVQNGKQLQIVNTFIRISLKLTFQNQKKKTTKYEICVNSLTDTFLSSESVTIQTNPNTNTHTNKKSEIKQNYSNESLSFSFSFELIEYIKFIFFFFGLHEHFQDRNV